MHRRSFIEKFSLLSPMLGLSRFSIDRARTVALPGEGENRVLLIVELSGGCDGLNALVPFRSDPYYEKRPRIATPAATVLPLSDSIGLHPSLAPLKKLYDDGALAIVQGVGYPNPSRTHFRSRDVWHTADPGKISADGWLARYLRLSGGPPALKRVQGEHAQPRALASTSGPAAAETIPAVRVKNYRSVVTYPQTPFARDLRRIAQNMAGDVETSVFYTTLGGFDTHADQVDARDPLLGVHSNLLKTYAEGVAAFYQDLSDMGRNQQVLILTFSEFGRRLEENTSLGTDHGTANPVLLLGGALNGGLHGSAPDLNPDSLDEMGDSIFTVDFRSVYATVLSRWLQTDPVQVLGSDFPLLGFV